MYGIEVCIPNKVPLRKLKEPKAIEEGREAEIFYDRKVIRINLTGIWDLACGGYASFVDELIGIILHEYLHYFFYVNGVSQNEKMIAYLSKELLILSLGHLIGATNNNEEEAREYEEIVDARFTR